VSVSVLLARPDTPPAVLPQFPTEPDTFVYAASTRLDRSQVEAALAELVGREPATLGAQLAPRPLWRDRVIEREMFEHEFALERRYAVWILATEYRVRIEFPTRWASDGEQTLRWIDEALTARWGAPAYQNGCSLWIDPVRQSRLSSCLESRCPHVADVDHVVLEWAHYLTPSQWVAARGERFGFEPFPLIGASRGLVNKLKEAHDSMGRGDHDWIWYPPPVGPEGQESSMILVEGRDSVVRWSIGVDTDPAPIARLLRAKYGKPIDDDGTCGTPGGNGHIDGRMTWEADGQRIEALCSLWPTPSIHLEVMLER
jgi:hypothetical protein